MAILMIPNTRMRGKILNQEVSISRYVCDISCSPSDPIPSAKKARKVTDEEEVNKDGILADIDVQPVTDYHNVPTQEDKTHDINEFFSKPFESAGANGKVKKHHKCKECP